MESLSLPRLGDAPLGDVGEGFHQIHFHALGSVCQLFYSASSRAEAEHFQKLAAAWMEQFENRFSRYLPASELNRINSLAGHGWIPVDKTTEVLLDLCAHSHFTTEGAFDATSLPLSQLWDWRKQRPTPPSESEIADALKNVGWHKIQRQPGALLISEPNVSLDFGGVGKEFAVDALRQLAEHAGLKAAMVDLGGDVALLGAPPEGGKWHVSIEDPQNPGTPFAAIEVPGGWSVATSGTYHRRQLIGGRAYSHVLDCRTGCPVTHKTEAVTVIAKRCVMAGLLSTAALIKGGSSAIALLERAPDVFGCLWQDGRLLETRGFRSWLAHPKRASVRKISTPIQSCI